MWGRVRNLFRGGVTASEDPATEALEAATPQSDTLPQELVVAIDNASVVWRVFQGDDEIEPETAAVVEIVGLGGWRLGNEPTSDRVARHFPDLSPAACRKAARLIESTVAARNMEAHRRQSSRRGWNVMEGVPTWY